MRFNHLVPLFNNPKVREAALWAMNRGLPPRPGRPRERRHVLHLPEHVSPWQPRWRVRRAGDFMVKGNMAKAQQLLKESGYDGKPIVVMRPTDGNRSTNCRWWQRSSCARRASRWT